MNISRASKNLIPPAVVCCLTLLLTACKYESSPPQQKADEGGYVYTPETVPELESYTLDELRARNALRAKDVPTPETASEPEPLISLWTYSQHEDDMGKGIDYLANVKSSNTVDFAFPYSGVQHASLTLRTHPRHGKNVIFKIEKGQFLCPSYDGCNVLVRFDDEKAINFSASGPADNSTETIFIQNYAKFTSKMQKANRVRISANIYQEGSPAFEFDVSNFDLNLYKPENK